MPRRRPKASRKAWDPRIAPIDPEVQALAEQVVNETAKQRDFGYWGDLPLGETWALTFSKSRDSGLLDVSNYEAIKEDLEKEFPEDVRSEHFSHWAVGWVDQLAVRMLDDEGRVTKAGEAVLKWKERLEDYPVADEGDLSDREYEATIENIESEGGLDDKTAKDVYEWLRENNEMALEPVDGGGGYPSSENINEALKGLGVLKEEEEEEEEGEEVRPVYIDPPEQLRFWGGP